MADFTDILAGDKPILVETKITFEQENLIKSGITIGLIAIVTMMVIYGINAIIKKIAR